MKTLPCNTLRTDERGASAVEYALLISCVLLVALVSMIAVGGSVLDMWQDSCTRIASVTSGGSC